MNLVLHFWNRQWQSVCFDEESGHGRVRWLSRCPAKAQGWAYRRGGVWYVVWSDGEQVVFQADRERWSMTGAFECLTRTEEGVRRFTISDGRSPVFEVSYKRPRRERDAAYDDLDLEQDDFFVYVSRLWSDQKWKASVIKSWAM